MKYFLIINTVFQFLIISSLFPQTEKNYLFGEWAYIKYESKPDKIARLHPKTLKEPFKLSFTNDTNFVLKTWNTMYGKYLTSNSNIKFISRAMTMAGEPPWGMIPFESFNKVNTSILKMDTLKLFTPTKDTIFTFIRYNKFKNKYLKFDRNDKVYWISKEFEEFMGDPAAGSLWIFKEEKTNKIDTLHLVNNSNSIFHIFEEDVYGESSSYMYAVKDKEGEYIHWVGIYLNSSGLSFSDLIGGGFDLIKESGKFRAVYPRMNRRNQGDSLRTANITFDVKDEKEFNIENIKYKNITVVIDKDSSPVLRNSINRNPYKKVFFSKGIGIIRIEYKDGRIFNLLEYKIIK